MVQYSYFSNTALVVCYEHAKSLMTTLESAVRDAEVSDTEYKSEEALKDVIRLITMLGGINRQIDKNKVRNYVGMNPVLNVPKYVPVLFKAQV